MTEQFKLTPQQYNFYVAWDLIQKQVHKVNVDNGWWESQRNNGELIALMHSELSEALEYIRNGNGVSDHVPSILGIEEELADVVIRIMDFAQGNQLDIGKAIIQKIQYNATRGYKHGGKAF